MAELFKKKAVVDHIPGEDDVDPSLLEENPAEKGNTQDFRDSNQDERYGNRITGSRIPQASTELIQWRKGSRSHVALRAAGSHKTIVSWWDEHVTAAIEAGDLEVSDMHTSAYRYASTHKLLPPAPPVSVGKKAALFNRAQTLTFVDPESPEWSSFVEKLRHLPDGSTIQTQDGYTLTKNGDTIGDGDILFILEDFSGAKDNLMPPMAIRQAAAGDQTFLGQHREDGSWSVQEVPEEGAEEAAQQISDAPDGNVAQVIQAPSGDDARGQLYEDMTSKGITPVDTTGFVRPMSASLVLKAGSHYLHLDEARRVATLVDKQTEATRFSSKTAAIMWKASEAVLAAAEHHDVRVVTLVKK